MPKLKTKSSAKKRFKISARGKVIMAQAGKRHGMIKRTNSAANWYSIDTERDPINPTRQHNINADTTSTESSNAGLASLDILSNGFKNRQGAGTGINDSGSTYIYMAFAENPFIGSQTLKGFSPVTAR